MKIIRTPDITKALYDEIRLRQESNTPEDEIHLGRDILYCNYKSFFRRQGKVPAKSDNSILLFALGYALQFFLFPKNKEEVYCIDGIHLRPDIDNQYIAGIHIPLAEVKSTRVSTKRFNIKEYPQYIEQCLGYCKAKQVTSAYLFVFFVCGCLAPETRILTEDLQWIPIKDIKIGDSLIGIEEFPNGYRKRRHSKKSVVLNKGIVKLPSYEIMLEDGRNIIASENHPWLQQEFHPKYYAGHGNVKWILTKDIKPGITMLKQFSTPWESCVPNHETGYLAGIFDGEGNVSFHHTTGRGIEVGFSQKAGETLNYVKILLKKYGFFMSKPSTNKQSKTIQLRIKNTADAAKFLSIIRPMRLLSKINGNNIGIPAKKTRIKVVGLRYLGEKELVGIDTSTKTYIVEGLYTHNSYNPPFPAVDTWRLDFEKKEVDNKWQEFLERKAVLEEALKTGEYPKKHYMAFEKECVYCEIKKICPIQNKEK